MSDDLRHLLDEALRLPLDKRAELAAELIASLDVEPDEVIDATWDDEMNRRLDRVRDGSSKGIDAHVLLARIEARLREP